MLFRSPPAPYQGVILSIQFFYLFPKKNRSLFDQLRPPSEHPCQPPIRALYYQYIFSTYFPTKNRSLFDQLRPPLSTPTSPPLWGRYIINIFFPPISRQKNRSLFDRICLSIFYSNGTRVSIPRAVFLFNFLELHSDTLFSLYYCFRLCL